MFSACNKVLKEYFNKWREENCNKLRFTSLRINDKALQQ
jgi:hypothetical protein